MYITTKVSNFLHKTSKHVCFRLKGIPELRLYTVCFTIIYSGSMTDSHLLASGEVIDCIYYRMRMTNGILSHSRHLTAGKKKMDLFF